MESKSISTPLGAYRVTVHQAAVVEVDRLTAEQLEEELAEGRANPDSASSAAVEDRQVAEEACRQLQEYFEGRRQEFDLPLHPVGTTFQQQVWQALKQIPYGETRTYKEIALAIGNPKAVRAVGMANNRNPVSIVVPCHRVIGSSGKLIGYGGGLDAKEFLLNLETVNKYR